MTLNEKTIKKADIGVVGLAVMGENLAMNLESNGYNVAVFNRSTQKVKDFVEGRAKGKQIIGTYSIKEFIDSLEKPRKLILMIKAGAPIDQFIDGVLPFLEAGDILIDGGNSHFVDTNRRVKALMEKDVLFVGAGISGGEYGALHGPSIMPGGAHQAWEHIAPILNKIAAKVDEDPCCRWIGPEGAGHFVKMVHNGIEYGDMQLISEAYYILRKALGLSLNEISDIFAEWNKGELNSYLIEITSEILAKVDQETKVPLVDLILDSAEQKGTGSWTSQAALELGVATPTITESVYARYISALKEERIVASKSFAEPQGAALSVDKSRFVEMVRRALFASKICSYAQGFALLREASESYGWDLNLGEIAHIWRNGCIIRAQFLDIIKGAFAQNSLPNLLMAPYFRKAVVNAEKDWRIVVAESIKAGLAIPGFASAISYFDSYHTERLPANIIQAQRDYFGAHTYQRIDRPGQFHTEWMTAAKEVASKEVGMIKK